MNAAWWLLIVLVALLAVWWLAGRPGWPRAEARKSRIGTDSVRSTEAGGDGPSTWPQHPEGESRHPDFAPTTVMPASAEDEALLLQQAAAEHEVALRAAYRAAEEAQARRQAEREAAEAQARQEAADEHARRELERQQLEAEDAERRRVDAEAARLAALPPPPPPTPAPALTRLPEQTLVMVVDDSKVVRVKTSRLLARHQYRVVLAEDGEQALQQLAGELPQVLITDVEMPGIDGIELTRRVRANAASAQLPVIMITSADDRLRDVANEVGVSVLLGKPYSDETLIASIEQLAGIAPAARLSHA